jgi:putative chitinase
MSFNFDFTIDKLAECVQHNKNLQPWYDAMVEQLPKYEINTVETVAGFIAQCQHESADFTVLAENLNYSAKGLRKVFKKYFPTDALAAQYQHKPVEIANKVYSNRMGNGSEKSGDGWKFRGRGILQITGKNNYAECSKILFNDNSLVQDPDKLLIPINAILSACWYWDARDVNKSCVNHDIKTMTLKINGGTNGLEERSANWKRALSVLGG